MPRRESGGSGRRRKSTAAPPGPNATERALRLLGSRALTLRQLEVALLRKGVPRLELDAALARVKELGYIDDAEVARGRAQRRVAKGEAPRLVARRLRAQGVPAETARAAAEEAAAGASEDALAAQALRQKLRGRPPGGPREKQRLARALIAKGHRTAAVAKALGLDETLEAFDDGSDEDR